VSTRPSLDTLKLEQKYQQISAYTTALLVPQHHQALPPTGTRWLILASQPWLTSLAPKLAQLDRTRGNARRSFKYRVPHATLW